MPPQGSPVMVNFGCPSPMPSRMAVIWTCREKSTKFMIVSSFCRRSAVSCVDWYKSRRVLMTMAESRTQWK
jgi:hypothetical protein